MHFIFVLEINKKKMTSTLRSPIDQTQFPRNDLSTPIEGPLLYVCIYSVYRLYTAEPPGVIYFLVTRFND